MEAVCSNRKAYHDYFIDEKIEAGLVLEGTEVKSLRDGRANLKDGYVLIKDAEAFLINCHINPYEYGTHANHEPERKRKLLLHKREIEKLEQRVQKKGYTLVPLRIYFKGPRAKLEIGLGRGKRQFEKRDSIKEREAKKDIERAVKKDVRK